MGNPAGVRRDFKMLEQRRFKAARLLEQGIPEAEVARRVGVHRQSINRWAKQLKVQGRSGLKAAGRAGRKPKLADERLKQLQSDLQKGPESFGYGSGLWTIERVADLIADRFGVEYHPGHVWRLLGKLGWSCQRPVGRALERDEEKIRRWKQVRWPQLKKKPGSRSARSSSSTNPD